MPNRLSSPSETPPLSSGVQRRPWDEPRIIFERELEVRAQGGGPPGPNMQGILAPLNASSGVGSGGFCT
ncbi:MAG: hypothetical protein GXP37_01055 [Chloroflexi bacterium]|nr:hypothetical protein [Chloroflexota bacterium]